MSPTTPRGSRRRRHWKSSLPRSTVSPCLPSSCSARPAATINQVRRREAKCDEAHCARPGKPATQPNHLTSHGRRRVRACVQPLSRHPNASKAWRACIELETRRHIIHVPLRLCNRLPHVHRLQPGQQALLLLDLQHTRGRGGGADGAAVAAAVARGGGGAGECVRCALGPVL